MPTAGIRMVLTAHDPMIVGAASFPGHLPKLLIVSIILSINSGALEANAIKVVLATVEFHVPEYV